VKPTTKNEDKHMKSHKYVGLDFHSDKIEIAIAEGERAGEVRSYGSITGDLTALEKVVRKLGGPTFKLSHMRPAGLNNRMDVFRVLALAAGWALSSYAVRGLLNPNLDESLVLIESPECRRTGSAEGKRKIIAQERFDVRNADRLGIGALLFVKAASLVVSGSAPALLLHRFEHRVGVRPQWRNLHDGRFDARWIATQADGATDPQGDRNHRREYGQTFHDVILCQTFKLSRAASEIARQSERLPALALAAGAAFSFSPHALSTSAGNRCRTR
jgi:hypothetical protein